MHREVIGGRDRDISCPVLISPQKKMCGCIGGPWISVRAG